MPLRHIACSCARQMTYVRQRALNAKSLDMEAQDSFHPLEPSAVAIFGSAEYNGRQMTVCHRVHMWSCCHVCSSAPGPVSLNCAHAYEVRKASNCISKADCSQHDQSSRQLCMNWPGRNQNSLSCCQMSFGNRCVSLTHVLYTTRILTCHSLHADQDHVEGRGKD